MSHGRFHDILRKEYSGTFPELLWGEMIYYKKICLLTMRVSQILSLSRLIPEVKYILCQKDFSLQNIFIGICFLEKTLEIKQPVEHSPHHPEAKGLSQATAAATDIEYLVII
jgi:hypothetical protein